MKKYTLLSCFIAGFVVAGCGGTTTHETLTLQENTAEVIELTEEEAQLLESLETTPDEEVAPVTKENYNDALKQLEEELDADL